MEDNKPKAVDTKPQVDGGTGDDENINLFVADQSAYCKKLGLSKQAVRFTFDGNRLREQDIPKACGVEDGDEIDVFQEQQGGAEGAFPI